MKIQNLITLGVILYIFFSIRKALKFGKKETRKGTAAPNWKDKLQDIANQIKDEIEKANRQNSPEMPPPIPVPRPVDPYGDDIQNTWVPSTDRDDEAILDSVDSDQAERPQPVLVLKKRPAVKQEKGRSGSSPHAGIQKPGMTQPGPKQSIPRKPMTLQQKKALRNLRRAVIWTEILSKPVSLRD